VDCLYESMMIIVPGLADPDREDIFQKVTKKVTALGGKVVSTKIWAQERDLTFVLQSRSGEKKKYSKGLYWLLTFDINTQKIPELKETIKLEERILRSLILKTERPQVDKILA
jgi:ribosomal protein S6